MSTNPHDIIANGNGGKYFTRTGSSRRAHRTEIEFRGMTLLVEYFCDGSYMPATETDPAEYPVCQVKAVEISTYGRSKSGEYIPVTVNATEMFKDFEDQIAECVERSWASE